MFDFQGKLIVLFNVSGVADDKIISAFKLENAKVVSTFKYFLDYLKSTYEKYPTDSIDRLVWHFTEYRKYFNLYLEMLRHYKDVGEIILFGHDYVDWKATIRYNMYSVLLESGVASYDVPDRLRFIDEKHARFDMYAMNYEIYNYETYASVIMDRRDKDSNQIPYRR